VVNFCAGGAGSVLYSLTFLLPACGPAPLGMSQAHFIRLFCVLLVALGFAAVGLESRKPMNARFLLHNLKRSWMSLEVLAGLSFMILAVMDIVSHHKVLQLGALAMGLILLVSQIMIIYDAKGVELWNTRLAAAHGLSSNLCLACGIGLVLFPFCAPFNPAPGVMIVLVIVTSNLILWLTILRSKTGDHAKVAVQPLRTPMNLIISIWFGHILPAAVLLLSMGLVALLEVNYLVEALLGLSGTMIVIGVTGQKAAIILGANSLKAIKPGPPKPGPLVLAR